MSPYREITRDDLVQHLVSEGLPPRDPSTGGLPDRVAETARVFVERLAQQLITGTHLPRPELDRVNALLDHRRPPGAILITGLEGSGKSAALAEIIRGQLVAGRPVAAVDIQSLSHEQDAEAVGRTQGLSMSPAAALAAVAGDRRAFLAFDAVDAVSISRPSPPKLVHVVKNLIREAQAHPNMTLVMTCRTEDLSRDDTMRNLIARQGAAPPIELGVLTINQVNGAIVGAGRDHTRLSSGQIELLQRPHLLRMYIDASAGDHFDFATPEELMAHYRGFLLKDDV